MTQVQKLHGELDRLEIGQQLNKHEYVSSNWYQFNYYTKRSFDSVLCVTRKLFKDKEFDSQLKQITRIR